MVPDAAAVISVARDQGMLAALAPAAIWVQMSTIGLAGINDVIAMVASERPDVVLCADDAAAHPRRVEPAAARGAISGVVIREAGAAWVAAGVFWPEEPGPGRR
jgi:hypothetical protein